MHCEHCGREFAAQRSTARFCSSNCRVYAFRSGSRRRNGTYSVTDDVPEQQFPLTLAACQAADRAEQEFYEGLRDNLGLEWVERLMERFVKAGHSVTRSDDVTDGDAIGELEKARQRIAELEEENEDLLTENVENEYYVQRGLMYDEAPEGLKEAHEKIKELEDRLRKAR